LRPRNSRAAYEVQHRSLGACSRMQLSHSSGLEMRWHALIAAASNETVSQGDREAERFLRDIKSLVSLVRLRLCGRDCEALR